MSAPIVTRYDDSIRALRAAAPAGRAGPSPTAGHLDAYVDKVRRAAYTVTDGDVETLKAEGLTEDEIFEHTVAAAVEAGLERLHAALRVLG